MGSFPVIVPPSPGLLCATGDLVAEFRNEFAQTIVTLVDEADGAHVAGILGDLGSRARSWMDEEGIAPADQKLTFVADMRYHLQGYEIPVAVDVAALEAGNVKSLAASFDVLHEQLYGFKMDDAGAEIVNLRSIANGAVPKIDLPSADPVTSDGSAALVDEHAIVHGGQSVATRIYDRAKLTPGASFEGPAIVTEFDSTTVVLPGYVAEVDRYYNILINPKKA